MTRTVTVCTVLYDAPWRNDGISDEIARFRKEAEARTFAATRKHYGEPCDVQVDEVPRRIASRWSLA